MAPCAQPGIWYNSSMSKIILTVAVKTAVSLPAETYRRAEALRRKARKSRSALYAEALEAYLKALETREKEARYEAGYRAMPETRHETAGATKASLASLELEDW